MLMFYNVGLWVSVLRISSLKFERAFVGHRFDQDTPIAETVRGYTSDVDGKNQLTSLNLRCKRFMMSFKLATNATLECLSAGHDSVRVSLCRDYRVKFLFIMYRPCNAK